MEKITLKEKKPHTKTVPVKDHRAQLLLTSE